MSATDPTAGVRHWIGDAPTSLHGNGAASFDLTTRIPGEVTCRLCLSILASDPPTPAEPDPTAGEHRALAVAEKADEMLRANHWRRGQAMFNALHEIDPALANHLRSTPADPFYRDERIGAFLDAVKAGPPTEPDAGDVEALAKAVYRSREVNLPLADSLDVDCHDVARAVLASDWLDAVRRKAGAKALTDLADDIDSTGYGWTSVVDAERFKDRLRDRAARIARESR